MPDNEGATNARSLARELMDREVNGELDAEALSAAIQRAVGRILGDLEGAVGADGLDALLDRAMAQAQRGHPVVASIGRAADAGMPLNIVTAIEMHGADAARAAVETVLAALVDILTALIGADMVRNLLHADDS